MNKNKKILILTMSCNDPYFKALLGAVRNTWAKPLIKNKYPDITWFSYTSCDKEHPKPMIDFDEHMIYVDVNDDTLNGTFPKTYKAYHMIRDIVDFDYVIRTNTSVFLNIDKLIERVNSVPDKYIMGNWSKIYQKKNENEYTNIFLFWLLIGFCFGMCKEYFDIATTPGEDDAIRYPDGSVWTMNDDFIMSRNIVHLTNNDTMCGNIEPNNILPLYKSFNEGDYFSEFDQEHNFKYINDPNLVNQYSCVRVRTFHKGENRLYRGHEIQNMYELYNALKTNIK